MNNPNKEMFRKIIEEIGLYEKIKQMFSDLDKEGEEYNSEPIKTFADEKKIRAYDELEVNYLPQDWRIQLERLKNLEKYQLDFLQIEKKLEAWTDVFGKQKPQEVQNEIETQRGKFLNIEIELKNSQQEIKNSKQELQKWINLFDNREFSEIKEEWENLNQRPDIPISTEEFYDDYAVRLDLEQSNRNNLALKKARAETELYWKQKQKLLSVIKKYLDDERTRKFIFEKPVVTREQAKQAIIELLELVKKIWNSYLEEKKIDYQNLVLDYNLKEEKNKSHAFKILDFIEKTKVNCNYKELFLFWNQGDVYNKKYDFDGSSLYLLVKHLQKYLGEENFGLPLLTVD